MEDMACSTDSLAQSFPKPWYPLQVTGDVTYNGRNFCDFLSESTSVYVPQDDQHMAELTVRETFSFGARCQGAGIYQGEACLVHHYMVKQ